MTTRKPERARNPGKSFWRDDDASAAVEFAIAFPLQLFITFGLLQFLLIGVATILVNHAAYAGARAAVVGEDPARAAVIVLAPLGGYQDPGTTRAQLANDIEIPGWGALAHARNTAEKVHVRLNDWPDPIPPRASPYTLADPNAYADSQRFTDSALAARREIADAFGNHTTARVVVEFDFELVFPLVDALYAAYYRTSGQGADAMAFGERDRAYLAQDTSYEWAWEPGVGYRSGVARVRNIGGANHIVIARECSMYRGFPLE